MLSINISELVLTILSFLLLLFLLNKFLFKPVISFTEERSRRIEAGLMEEREILERQEKLRRQAEAREEERRQQMERQRAEESAARIRAHQLRLDQIRLEAAEERILLREKAVTRAGEAAGTVRAEQDALARRLVERILGR